MYTDVVAIIMATHAEWVSVVVHELRQETVLLYGAIAQWRGYRNSNIAIPLWFASYTVATSDHEHNS